MDSVSPPPSPPYRGRFAPSPSGPLHLGSLVAALGCYLDARAVGGEWLLRIEDIDTPRVVAGAANEIIDLLTRLGFHWDGEIVWQSRRLARYAEALDALIASGDAYPCACSRREIADSRIGRSVDGGQIYPGTCRNGLPPGRAARAWRMAAPEATIGFTDRIQRWTEQNLAREVGDFALRRADGLFAYQLAVVIDDAEAGITDIVRGADLIDSTPRQIWLQQRLNLPTPHHAHLPVVTNAAGEKLSKQTLAAPVRPDEGSHALAAALRFLGQTVPIERERESPADFLRWAVAHWRIEQVPRQRAAQWAPP